MEKSKNNNTLNTITLFLIIGLMYPLSANAAEKLFPGGCQVTGFSFKYLTLMLHPDAAGRSQSIYFMHNKSQKTINLYQMRTGNEAYIMHFNNRIKPNQWGVYATDEKQVKFICTMASKRSKYGDVVDCKKVVELCEYPNVKFALNNYGNYWAISSNTKSGAKYGVIRQGVLLKW